MTPLGKWPFFTSYLPLNMCAKLKTLTNPSTTHGQEHKKQKLANLFRWQR